VDGRDVPSHHGQSRELNFPADGVQASSPFIERILSSPEPAAPTVVWRLRLARLVSDSDWHAAIAVTVSI